MSNSAVMVDEKGIFSFQIILKNHCAKISIKKGFLKWGNTMVKISLKW
jgi:hypothetical protein